MAENIINKNLDQFGLPYGEGQIPSMPQNFVPTMPDINIGANDLNDFATNMVPGLGQHINDLENIKNTTRGAEYFRESTNNMIQNLSDAYGRAPVVGGINRSLIETMAAPLSGIATVPYEAYSAYDRMEPGSGFKGYREALAKENMGKAMANRFVGAAQPLANRIESGNFPLSLNNVMDMGRSIKDNVGNFFFSPAGAAEISPTTNRNFVNAPEFRFTDYLQGNYDLNQNIPSSKPADAISRTNVQGMDYEMDPAAQEGFLNPNIQPSQNMFQRAGNFVKDLELEEYLPFMGKGSLTGMMGRGIGNLFQNIAPARYGTSQRAYNALSPQGRSAVGGIYGPRGIMSGYNAVSAFGRGPVGAINNRISNIQNRKAAQTDASRETIKDLYEARNRAAGVSMEGRTYTGFGKTGMGRDPNDVTGGAGPSGGSSKIVCTMMNESYGFGNFRNKIWLKHSKDLPKEYEAGYHKIFLPLVKFAKEEGKLNKVVKKTLEHIARHRTLDLKQEMKGKTHTLGRVYRKILEPICFLVGKASMFVRRG